jgi:hypothetical protein
MFATASILLNSTPRLVSLEWLATELKPSSFAQAFPVNYAIKFDQ